MTRPAKSKLTSLPQSAFRVLRSNHFSTDNPPRTADSPVHVFTRCDFLGRPEEGQRRG